MTSPTSSLDAHFQQKEAIIETALIALRHIASPHCPNRQFRAQYALVDIGLIEDGVRKPEQAEAGK